MLTRRQTLIWPLLAAIGLAASIVGWRDRRMLQKITGNWIGETSSLLKAGLEISAADIRAALIEEIWSGNGYPTANSFTTSNLDTTDILAAWSISPSNLLQYDAHTYDIQDNTPSTISTINFGVWRPTTGTSNNKLVMQFTGHSNFSDSLNPTLSGHGYTQGNLVQELVQAGYTVCVGEMAFNGNLTTHNTMPSPSSSLNALRYFLDGAVTALNALYAEGFENVFAVGLSGGGWTSLLLSALDTRIRAADSHAGWYPLYITIAGRDWEQFLHLDGRSLAALESLDYTDLAVLACQPNRTHVQSNNDQDTYWTQAAYDAATPYLDIVRNVAAKFGGRFDLQFDVSSLHQYTAGRRAAIIALFDGF